MATIARLFEYNVTKDNSICAKEGHDLGKMTKFASESTIMQSTEAGWATGNDRFGAVTLIRQPMGDCLRGTRFILTL